MTSRLKHYPAAALAICAYTLLGLIWLLALWQFLVVMLPRVAAVLPHHPIVNTPPCNTPDCDFSMFWPAGLLARAGQYAALYQPLGFLAWRHAVLLAGAQRLDWFYPPPALLPTIAVSYLPFHAAFAVWTLAGIALAAAILRWAGLGWRVILLSLVSPAALWNIEMGQLEILCGAFAAGGLLMADAAPYRAGAMLGLLIIKPQAGLLAPIAMLARLNRRGIAAGLGTVAIILVTVTALLGWPVWRAYFATGPALARQTLTAFPPIGWTSGIPVFWMIRGFGAGVALSFAVQWLSAFLAAVLVWLIWRSNGFTRTGRMALTMFLSLLATPYGYTDDMVGYSIALAALAQERNWRIDPLDALLWLWPALCPIVTAKTGILLTPVFVALAIARTWGRDLPRAQAAGLAVTP